MGKKPKPTRASAVAPNTRASAVAPKTIAFAELFKKVGSGRLTEEEFADYFYSMPPPAGEYIPRLAINTATVNVRGAEKTASSIGNELGFKAVETIRQQKLVALGAPAPDGTIVAEGDSWFNLPEFGWPLNIPPTLIDILAATKPISNIAHWGDTLAQIVNAAEYAPLLQAGGVKLFLFSAGGNDVLGGGHLASLLRQRVSGDSNPNNAASYINPLFGQHLDEVMLLYKLLVDQVRALSPKTTVLVHGYDFAHPVPMGPWLGSALEFRGFRPDTHQALCRAIIKVMLQRFNDRLKDFADASGGRVVYVKLLDTVKDDWWDELHPNRDAAKRLAAKFAAKM